MRSVMRQVGWLPTGSLRGVAARHLSFTSIRWLLFANLVNTSAFPFVNISPLLIFVTLSPSDWQDANKTVSHVRNRFKPLISESFYTDELDSNQVSIFMFCSVMFWSSADWQVWAFTLIKVRRSFKTVRFISKVDVCQNDWLPQTQQNT